MTIDLFNPYLALSSPVLSHARQSARGLNFCRTEGLPRSIDLEYAVNPVEYMKKT